MGQTSNERLRDYLVQLPPQAQALLMREFERAIERGEDTAVASFVLEQLRKVVRGTDEDVQPRTDNPARLLFRPIEPFLVESHLPTRPGQIRRSSLLPVWQWLVREGAPDPAREFEEVLARGQEGAASAELDAAVRKFQISAADAILRIATPAPGGDRQRALHRVGSPEVIEDLLPIGAILQNREALEALGDRLPGYIRVFERGANRLGRRRAQCSDAANAAIAAVRAVAGHAASQRAVANHQACRQDCWIRR